MAVPMLYYWNKDMGEREFQVIYNDGSYSPYVRALEPSNSWNSFVETKDYLPDGRVVSFHSGYSFSQYEWDEWRFWT
jgi:hypothetical protein